MVLDGNELPQWASLYVLRPNVAGPGNPIRRIFGNLALRKNCGEVVLDLRT